MLILAVVLTVLLLCETLPSAAADLGQMQAGTKRLDKLTRLGLAEGRNRWVLPLLGGGFLAASAAVIAGLWAPAAGAGGAAIAAVIFGWVLWRQLRAGDRGGSLGAYLLFLAMALAVLVVDLLR